MRKSMIIGKRQMILAALVMALGVAVYLNWQFADTDGGLDLTAAVNSARHIGDAQFVNNPAVSDDEAGEANAPAEDELTGVERARQSRDRARRESMELLRDIIDDARTDDESRQKAVDDTGRIIRDIEVEGLIEGLIAARGIADSAVIINGQSVDVIVQTDELDSNQVLQIQDIVLSQTGLSLEHIKVHEAN